MQSKLQIRVHTIVDFDKEAADSGKSGLEQSSIIRHEEWSNLFEHTVNVKL